MKSTFPKLKSHAGKSDLHSDDSDSEERRGAEKLITLLCIPFEDRNFEICFEISQYLGQV